MVDPFRTPSATKSRPASYATCWPARPIPHLWTPAWKCPLVRPRCLG